jgi:bacillithiol biosynthesis deacetylase BshB1
MANRKKNPTVDLLTVMAHPDDAELTCGGTLIRAIKQGYRVGILDLTRGEMGTRGTPELRAKEAVAAGKALGLHHREALELPDSHLEPILEYKLTVAARIRALRPSTVILSYWEARHPDHYTACQIGYEACFLAGLAKADLPGKPHRPHKIIHATLFDSGFNATPSFIVDITPYFKQRMRAVACFGSQLKGPKRQGGVHIPLTGLEKEMATRCEYFGQLIGVEYGEPFAVRDPLQVDDIVKLGGRPF